MVCGCCRRLFDHLVRPREGDTPEDVWIKRIAYPVSLFIFFLTSFVGVNNIGRSNMMSGLGNGICAGGHFLFMAGVVLNLGRARYLIDAALIINAVGLCVSDLGNATLSYPFRIWSYVVLILDAALVLNRVHIPRFVAPFTLLYIAAESVESSYRYGLYDLGYWKLKVEDNYCSCASPPCELSATNGSINFLATCSVFLIDFYYTRGFANALRDQLRSVESSVAVAEDVAAALARYDVDAAEKAINEGMHLPPGLEASYRRLLSNLRSYGDYLPEALLFHEDEASPLRSPVPPPVPRPGAEGLGIVFTDIQSSTALWEEYPQEMYDALRTHNTTLRTVAKENEGYEVKIIGDALMLAFSNAMQAVTFGAEAQLQLVHSDWPPELCQHPLCKRVVTQNGVLLQHGLRVRIGINWGAVEAEKNPVTGRYDYFGPTVNTASRVEAVLKCGGLTGMTQAVVDEVGQAALERAVLAVPIGTRKLKGLSAPVPIYVVLPFEFKERLRLVQLECPMTPDRPPHRPDRSGQISTFTLGSPTCASPMLEFPNITRDRRASSAVPPLSSSHSSYSLDSFPVPASSHLNLGLTGSSATCVCVRGNFKEVPKSGMEAAVTRFLVATETAALRTEGQVAGVMSSLCLLAWNAGSRCCADHLGQSAHFVTLLKVPAHSGIATGSVLSGNISGTRRRHVIVAGSCVELGVALSEAAARRKLPFLAAGEAGCYLGRQRLATRLAKWTEAAGGVVEVWGAEDGPMLDEYDERYGKAAEVGGDPTEQNKNRCEKEGWVDLDVEVEGCYVSSFPDVGA
eukprot:Hpha_TRINITY_DN15800_c6_g5::TRINITY_DN15800_c6_g5_i1::g.187007::m.187007